ncbi:MAG: hypothetical protein IJT42_01205 [Treponema sp.]|nr:hypothetical protein [Treponema sp.]
MDFQILTKNSVHLKANRIFSPAVYPASMRGIKDTTFLPFPRIRNTALIT